MKRLKILIPLAFLAILIISCVNNEQATTKKYYAFDSLLNAQVIELSLSKAELTKHVEIGEKEEVNTFVPADSLAWKNELEIFDQLQSVNKPVNRDAFAIESKDDTNSNLKRITFSTEKNIALKSISLFYLTDPSNIRKIEATVNERNSLYKSARKFTLNFSEIHNKVMLTSYSIDGGQHMMFGDSVQFKITSSIRID